MALLQLFCRHVGSMHDGVHMGTSRSAKLRRSDTILTPSIFDPLIAAPKGADRGERCAKKKGHAESLVSHGVPPFCQDP